MATVEIKVPEIGAFVVYGTDPRTRGFTLDPRLVSKVTGYEKHHGVLYVVSRYESGAVLRIPADDATEIIPFD